MVWVHRTVSHGLTWKGEMELHNYHWKKWMTSHDHQIYEKYWLIVLAFTFDLQAVEEHLKLAYKAYKLAKKDASMWRNDHLASLAQAKADMNGTNDKTEARNLIIGN